MPGEDPAAFVRRASRDKALAVAERQQGAWVLGADTVVVVDGAILGKPGDSGEACGMLERLSGREHQVLTGVTLLGPDGGAASTVVVTTGVVFRELGREEIEVYVASGEPLDKAGAYAIQGGAGAFVTAVDGSYSNVVGLPLEAVRELLVGVGLLGADVPGVVIGDFDSLNRLQTGSGQPRRPDRGA